MEISIWWLIVLAQLTLVTSVLAIVYAFGSRTAKRKNKSLQQIVESTIQDYDRFVAQLRDNAVTNSQPLSDDKSETVQAPAASEDIETPPTESDTYHAKLLDLFNTGLAQLPQWTSALPVEHFVPHQLPIALELHFTHMFLEPQTADIHHWTTFANSLATHISDLRTQNKEQLTLLKTLGNQWVDQKSSIEKAFDDLVVVGQKTEVTDQIHQSVNKLYNGFISIIDLIPEVEANPADALLKMEATSPSKNINHDSSKNLEKASPSLAEVDDHTISQTNAVSNVGDEDEETFDRKTSAIPTDEATEQSGVDDDLFDDILATMDEVIDENKDASAANIDSKKQALK